MKIVSRKALMALPAGTLFSEFEPDIFGPLCIKGASMDFDFLMVTIRDAIDHDSSTDFGPACDAMQAGDDVPMDFKTMGREALFNDAQLYAVWSDADVENLIACLVARKTAFAS